MEQPPTGTDGSPATPASDADARVDRARRRLLRAGVYVAPAVIGWMLTHKAGAQGQPPSCNPCTTCNPYLSGCNPAASCPP